MKDFNSLERIDNGHTNGGMVYRDQDKVYKLFTQNSSFIDEKHRNVVLLKEKRWFSPFVLDIFYEDGEFVGYSEEYIEDAKSFKEGIDDPTITVDFKIKIIEDIYRKMKTIHQKGFLLGDIHLENLVYNNREGFIIDLDELRIPGKDDFKFSEYYTIYSSKSHPYIKVASLYTDNVKAMIASLSLLYSIDLEEIAKEFGIDRLKSYLGVLIEDKEFKNKVFEILNNKCGTTYFDEILRDCGKIKSLN